MFNTPRPDQHTNRLTPEREALIIKTVFEREVKAWEGEHKLCLSVRDKDIPADMLKQFPQEKVITRSRCSLSNESMQWQELFSKQPVLLLNITEISPVKGKTDEFEVKVDMLSGPTAQERGKRYVLGCNASGACEVRAIIPPTEVS